MKYNNQYEQKKRKTASNNKRGLKKIYPQSKKDIFQRFQNYLSTSDDINLDIMFERALENIKRKNSEG